jgi:hypothetical protein
LLLREQELERVNLLDEFLRDALDMPVDEEFAKKLLDPRYAEETARQWETFRETVIWDDIYNTIALIVEDLNTQWQEGAPGAAEFNKVAWFLRRALKAPEYARARADLARVVADTEASADDFKTDMEVLNDG